ncbi:MAG: hypothetical protein K2Q06_00670 [Parvularculaceae bacterium]|nr:hypothetical protein [Parvularculaceae bacterium]
MERPNTVSGLLEKRRQLADDLKEAEKAVRNLRIDLDHIDATIRLFTEDAPTRVASRPVAHRATRGAKRHVMEALKVARSPVTSLEVATAYISARGLAAADETQVLIRKRVGACLTDLKARGIVKEIPQARINKGWLLASPS